MRRPAVLATAALGLAVVTGCADSRTAAVPGASAAPATVRADLLPARVVGLRAAAEDVSKQVATVTGESYVTDTRLWSLREGERLRATLQVSAFGAAARVGERDFERRIVAQIGSAVPNVRVVDGRRVYVTSGNKQSLYVWFAGRHFLVLSAAADYPTPRTLLRELVAVRP